MTSAPRVSVILPAFNLARFLPAAIDSALSQQPPGGAVEVIVVDDGSTDDTPAVLAAYGERIRSIRRPNGGLVAAIDTGLAAVIGEFVALLDADDEWPRDRLARHVQLLDANPAVGLVHSDMEVIDDAGNVTEPSFFATQREPPTDGRVLGRLLAGNFVSGGASTFRASLLPALHPIDPEAAYPDWWLAACVAALAEIRLGPGIGNRYRFHGANMGLGSGPQQQPKIQRGELGWRRWMMRNLVGDPSVTVEHLRVALGAWNFGLMAAAMTEPGGAHALLTGDPAAAAPEVAAAAALRAAGRPSSRTLLRALSHDPFDGATLVDLELALNLEVSLPQPALPPPLITLEARDQLAVAWLDEVLARPSLLHSFAAEAGVADETLAVLSPLGADLSRLIALVEGEPSLRDGRLDITVINEPATTPGQLWLSARAGSLLSAVTRAHPYASLPAHPAVERDQPATWAYSDGKLG